MPLALLLIRHCQSMSQSPGAGLTEAGARQAKRLATRLAALGIDALYSSPFERARQSLAPFAASSGIPVKIDARLAERRLAARDLPDWVEHIRRSFDDFDHRAPGGESLREAQARGLAAIEDIAGAGHGRPAACTHGNLLSALLRSIDGRFGFGDWQALANPDLFWLRCEGRRPVAFERVASEGEFDNLRSGF
jgi:2,3-bisphosphoglycerate-dependent phosphoglycerate mutase